MSGRGPGLRVRWMSAAVREMQLLAGELAEATGDGASCAIRAARLRVPDPQTPAEQYLLEHFFHKAALAALSPRARTVVDLLTSLPPAESEACAPLAQAERLLETRFIEPWTADRLARHVGCSRHFLVRCFRSRYGMSIHSFLTVQRLRAAALLLSDEHAKIEAVSALVGYKSKKNFYAEFRKTIGVTPAQFRSRCRAG